LFYEGKADVGGYNINTLLTTTTTLRRHLDRGVWVHVCRARGILFNVGDVATNNPSWPTSKNTTLHHSRFSGPSFFTLTALFRDVSNDGIAAEALPFTTHEGRYSTISPSWP
ncbi:unnamed protein product, partial [Ectocarpus sp. 8 AP-2014]